MYTVDMKMKVYANNSWMPCLFYVTALVYKHVQLEQRMGLFIEIEWGVCFHRFGIYKEK